MLHQFDLFASELFLSMLKALGHFWHLKSKRRHQRYDIDQMIMLKYIKIKTSKVWGKYEIIIFLQLMFMMLQNISITNN